MNDTATERGLIEHIVSAARGGRRRQASVNRAIEMACENEAQLTFLYVLDLDFMKNTSMGRPDFVFDELDKMGEFMMIRLVEYAQEEGCENADFIIRHGQIRDEIIAYLRETQPDLLVLGRPQQADMDEAPPAFEVDGITEFAQKVTEETGVQVILV